MCCGWSSRLRMERSARKVGPAAFALVREGDRQETLSEWYAIRSDTRQREKLRCAITETTSDRWKRSPRAPDDLKWLLDRVDKLASERNNAIHAPCSLYLRGDGSSEVMAAVRSANAGNRRAKDLEGKDLLTEFHWCAAYALRLGQFAGMLAPAMASPDHYEWPARPKIPSRADVLESEPRMTGLEARSQPRVSWRDPFARASSPPSAARWRVHC